MSVRSGALMDKAAGSSAAAQRTHCARHRNVETYLRCGKCGTPICPKCLVHTPVGARCPDCARPTKVARRGGIIAVLAATGAGLGVGMLGGIVLSFLPGGLLFIPLILTGFLVGEAVSAASNRRGGRGLVIIAFTCAVVGPILGRAVLTALLLPLPAPALRATVAFGGAVESLGIFGLLLLMLAGVIASTRVDR